MAARILIADADVRLTQLIRDHLVRRGFFVRTAATGVGCIARLREFRPNVLVVGTSLLWGGCEGVLAALDDPCDLRPEIVIVLARTRERKTLHRLASYDVDGYRWKPLSPASLARYVEIMLAQQPPIAVDR